MVGNTQVANQWGQASSVIARWEVQSGLQDKISGCFDQLSNKKKGTNGVAARVGPCISFLLANNEALLTHKHELNLLTTANSNGPA